MTPTPAVRAVVAALVVLTAFVGPVAAGPSVDRQDGHRIQVGGEGQQISIWVHVDLFTNLGSAGELGFSAVGRALNTRVLVIDLQLQFDGVGAPTDFLADPFSRFSVVAEWELNLPFLSAGPATDDTFDYTGNESVGNESSAQIPPLASGSP